MSLSFVTLSESLDDGSDTPIPSGVVTFTPTVTAYYGGGPAVLAGVPVQAQIVNGSLVAVGGGQVRLLASDNTGLTFEGRTGFLLWTVSIQIGSETDGWMFYLPSSPSSTDLYALAGTGLPTGSVIPDGGKASNPAFPSISNVEGGSAASVARPVAIWDGGHS